MFLYKQVLFVQLDDFYLCLQTYFMYLHQLSAMFQAPWHDATMSHECPHQSHGHA